MAWTTPNQDRTRLEGQSDPADMAVVVPLECPNCGSRGTLILDDGPDASAEEADVLTELSRHPAATRRVEGPDQGGDHGRRRGFRASFGGHLELVDAHLTWLVRDASAAGEARSIVSEFLGHAVPKEELNAATLVASELVTNALLHTSAATIDLRLERLSHHLVIEVSDNDRTDVLLAAMPGPDALAGRGLGIVSAISSEWGIRQRPDGKDGKTVWAAIPID